MTKEELYNNLWTAHMSAEPSNMANVLNAFFEQNVVIPKGKNRHQDADALHEWVEGSVEGVFKYPYGTHRGIAKHIFTEYSDFKIEEFKPLKPVYEWQLMVEENGYWYVGDTKYYTEQEIENFRGKYKKIEETKRERQ